MNLIKKTHFTILLFTIYNYRGFFEIIRSTETIGRAVYLIVNRYVVKSTDQHCSIPSRIFLQHNSFITFFERIEYFTNHVPASILYSRRRVLTRTYLYFSVESMQ